MTLHQSIARKIALGVCSLHITGTFLCCGVLAQAAEAPSVSQALRLVPTQEEVDMDRPTGEEIEKCTLESYKDNSGWVVLDPQGRTLRTFVDTDGDKVLDQWSYYKNGLEVFRDIDTNGNTKVDKCRWFHTNGLRTGIDENEDGVIDRWEMISAEEVTQEIARALTTRDIKRFMRVTLTPRQLQSLGVGPELEKKIGQKLSSLESDFQKIASESPLARGAEWVQFSGNRPGLVPAGKNGQTKDIQVYQNVVAIVQDGQAHKQLFIGTLIRVGDTWRTIDVPTLDSDRQTAGMENNIFYPDPDSLAQNAMGAVSPPSEKVQKMIEQIEELQVKAQSTPPDQVPPIYDRIVDLMIQVANESDSESEYDMWIRQTADIISAAVQTGTYPSGGRHLTTLLGKAKAEDNQDLTAHIRFRQITADYYSKLLGEDPDYAEIQVEWMKDLEAFANEYPDAPATAEAMLQLALNREFGGQEDDATKWYEKIVERFPNSEFAKKAEGSLRRLQSVGKQLTFQGNTVNGKKIDISNYRGNVVLLHFWASWSDPSVENMEMLKSLAQRYGNMGLEIIGINLDNDPEAMSRFLSQNPLPWPQIHEKGGLDSRPANYLGVQTPPMMMLIDKDGRVIRHNVQTVELDRELRNLIR
jgi:thiol-disulfide isomerase/thioredoxin